MRVTTTKISILEYLYFKTESRSKSECGICITQQYYFRLCANYFDF